MSKFCRLTSTIVYGLPLFFLFAAGCTRGPVEVPQAESVDQRYTESKSSEISLLRIQSLSVRNVSFLDVFKGISTKDVQSLAKETFQSYLEIPVSVSPVGNNFLDITVTAFREREGSSAGAVVPASVSLEMKVMTTQGGKVWEGKFASNEKDIISNLLQESDGNFASGRELLKRALSEGARGFADARLKVFRR